MADWTTEEVILTVRDYFDMLIQELSGQQYNKSQHRRNLQKQLNQRSESAVEYKHRNVSAVLIEMGLPYISGYKPLPNYQELLKESVEDHLIENSSLEEIFNKSLFDDFELPKIKNIQNCEVKIPDVDLNINESPSSNRYKTKRNYYKEELKNRRLGLLGEEFIIHYEKEKLITSEKNSLAKQIEHISQTQGDSAGYDILSFNKQGKEKFIEVKTTQLGKESPFYFTRNELGFSREKGEDYNLYRVFSFRKKPQFYRLQGALDKSCESFSTEFMGWPK